ncbi:MAG: 2-oxoglutarate dehydrogenase subunit E1, partial [Pseudobdellovibrionaceae bacterium]
YGKQLIRETVIDQKYYDDFYNEKISNLQKVLDDTRANPPKVKTFKFDGFWKGLRRATSEDFTKDTNTKIDIKILKDICKLLSEVPAGFTPNAKLAGERGLLGNRARMAKGEQPLDWGTGELLAYGSLLKEGTSIRLTGQDCVRGTFTHRHSALYDQKTGEPFAALDQIDPDKVEFCVYDSVLSEYGVLGFEYGNSISDPTFLTLWEAQFGDFGNGAQIIIDQFLAAGESKWQQMNGLVLLLPHGYEGQGPEHSSARLERFLQLCAQYNMQVANLTTPAQIYHALRRQIKREFRKPLIIMSPKSLLRHPRAVSSLEDLANGTFQEVINDPTVKDPKKVETVVFVSGKLFYELLEEKEKLGAKADRTALVRLEQIYPFPAHKVEEVLKLYPKMKNFVWTQEEPQNNGSWGRVYFDFKELFKKMKLKDLEIQYVGRDERASPATGSEYKHKKEQTEIINGVFNI